MIEILMPTSRPRLERLLNYALKDVAHRYLSHPDQRQGNRILFALSCDELGMDGATLTLLRQLRESRTLLEGCCGAVFVDGATELYTKQLGQELVLAANGAGCCFPGKPLLEGTGSLYNQHILAEQRSMGWEDTYLSRGRELIQRLITFEPPRFFRPKVLMLHASEYGRSSTLELWTRLKRRLEPACEIREVSLRNGTIHDCRGCSYNACLHFAKNDTCFYGGAISETVLPAIRDCDLLLFLCPNYNDGVSANITALFNRLTSLLLHSHLYDKYLYGIVVSGYSGSDLVAKQLLGTMCLNKTAMLPPRFCLLQTANDLSALEQIKELDAQLDIFAADILQCVK